MAYSAVCGRPYKQKSILLETSHFIAVERIVTSGVK